jgi:hypothetical protein
MSELERLEAKYRVREPVESVADSAAPAHLTTQDAAASSPDVPAQISLF